MRGRVEPDGPIAEQAAAGAELVVNINASPYHAVTVAERSACSRPEPRTRRAALVYVNLVGGQDELVFEAPRSSSTRTVLVALPPVRREVARRLEVGRCTENVFDFAAASTAPLPRVVLSPRTEALDVRAPPVTQKPEPGRGDLPGVVVGTHDYVPRTDSRTS